MKKKSTIRLALGLLALLSFSVVAQVHVSGYTRKDGTYVAPHMRSNPNSTKLDNYSTRGNVNPYTGKIGTADPYARQSTNPYAQPQQRTQDPYSTQQEDSDDDGY
ncbi:MAG: hypothetical protein ABIU96_04945 [Rhodanobacter sp.]